MVAPNPLQLPDDLRVAHDAACDCLNKACGLLRLIELTNEPCSADIEHIPHSAAICINNLLNSLEHAHQVVAPVSLELARVFDDAAWVAKKPFGSFHQAALKIAGKIFFDAWGAADLSGCRVKHFRPEAIEVGWRDACQKFQPPEIDQSLSLMISKEAMRAAERRSAGAPISAPPLVSNSAMSSTDLAEKYGVDKERLRKALETFRATSDRGYVEVQNRSQSQPKYLYDEEAVGSVIKALKERS